jgi:hypothetical protein
MIQFFFYNDFSFIKQQIPFLTITDGYILVESYDVNENKIQINKCNKQNNVLLLGKIITFNDSLDNLMNIINNQMNVTCQYTTIWANKRSGGTCLTHLYRYI